MERKFDDYYLGLDMGTNSVGWAVTDLKYKVPKYNKKRMIGAHLFDEANSAKERRTFRSARRRLHRRTVRLKILKELFSEEIAKVDPGFYQRMEDSFFYPEDKSENQIYSLFNDRSYTDKDYYKEFPTIYHLRKKLIETNEKLDIRLLFLGIHHILKNRGHFLFSGKELTVGSNLEELLIELNKVMKEAIVIDEMRDSSNQIPEKNFSDLIEIIKNSKLNLKDKDKQIADVLNLGTNSKVRMILKIVNGSKVDLNKIFPEILEDESISIKYPVDIEEFFASKGDSLNDNMVEIILSTKAIYDTIRLMELMHGEKLISNAKVSAFNTHKEDLKTLKKVIKKYFDSKTYKDFFSNPNKNYANYVSLSSNKDLVEKPTYKQEEINASIKKLLEKTYKENSKDKDLKYLVEKAELNLLLPKQKVVENSTIPYQLHRKELELILSNAEKFYPFLSKKDESGYTISEKNNEDL